MVGYKIDTGNIWITRDGSMVDIGQMDDEHLIATIEMLESRTKKVREKLGPKAGGRDVSILIAFEAEVARRKKCREYADMSFSDLRWKITTEEELLEALLIRASMPDPEVNRASPLTETVPCSDLRPPEYPIPEPGNVLPPSGGNEF